MCRAMLIAFHAVLVAVFCAVLAAIREKRELSRFWSLSSHRKKNSGRLIPTVIFSGRLVPTVECSACSSRTVKQFSGRVVPTVFFSGRLVPTAKKIGRVVPTVFFSGR